MTSPSADLAHDHFQGFKPFFGNFINCPNQFLDLCLPNRSRGLVRVVGYLIFKTYSCVDALGMPVQTQFALPWNDLVKLVGVSRGSVSKIKNEGQKFNYLHIDPVTNLVSLKMAPLGAPYRKTEEMFEGFFVGRGHRTKLPEQFFDVVLPNQPLRVLKFVGTVFRFTIGFEESSGYRRSQHYLSLRFISKHANLSHRHTFDAAELSSRRNFVVRIHPGNRTQAAVYGPSWCVSKVARIQSETTNLISRVQKGNHLNQASKFKKGTTTKVQKGNHEDSERESVEFKKGTNLKKLSKTPLKEQQVVVENCSAVIQLLREAGVSHSMAQRLTRKRGLEVVRRQLGWLDHRNPRTNRVGMLCKSIDEDWSPPAKFQLKRQKTLARERDRIGDEKRKREVHQIAQQKQARQQRKKRLMHEWERASQNERQKWISEAVKVQTSAMIQKIIRKQGVDSMSPHVEVLDIIAVDRKLPKVTDLSSPASTSLLIARENLNREGDPCTS